LTFLMSQQRRNNVVLTFCAGWKTKTRKSKWIFILFILDFFCKDKWNFPKCL